MRIGEGWKYQEPEFKAFSDTIAMDVTISAAPTYWMKLRLSDRKAATKR